MVTPLLAVSLTPAAWVLLFILGALLVLVCMWAWSSSGYSQAMPMGNLGMAIGVIVFFMYLVYRWGQVPPQGPQKEGAVDQAARRMALGKQQMDNAQQQMQQILKLMQEPLKAPEPQEEPEDREAFDYQRLDLMMEERDIGALCNLALNSKPDFRYLTLCRLSVLLREVSKQEPDLPGAYETKRITSLLKRMSRWWLESSRSVQFDAKKQCYSWRRGIEGRGFDWDADPQ